MKIAVTYENGNVFQHFGRTENFKIYEVEGDQIISSEVVGTNGTGHEALAGLLADGSIDVLICGGIGGGAQNALDEVGIEVYSGAQGDADEAVAIYLRGELVSTGVNCDHHQEEHQEAGGCSGACGSCAGGCGGYQTNLTGKNVLKTVAVHYRGTLNDGTQFDSSYDRGEPLVFVCGSGMMIAGFDAAVADMEVGEVVDVHLMPEEAYGMTNPDAIIELKISDLPGCETLNVGEHVYLTNNMGQQFPVKVIAKDEENITFDGNHELAGKELNFTIELVSVR